MEKFVRLVTKACPLLLANVDTDQILPARFLKLPRSSELGRVLFHDLRRDAEGNERPDFPLNQPVWRDARVLVAGRNFGGGSSREAAVYALTKPASAAWSRLRSATFSHRTRSRTGS